MSKWKERMIGGLMTTAVLYLMGISYTNGRKSAIEEIKKGELVVNTDTEDEVKHYETR